ncbi:uncharacterized protein L3040_002308 [Drepanopeziza brunnea f. sp. 'multigermtubi']|uniref:Uncharacterized protein n=1 Tax=Marssonina brunnea f. sp. multigermtubi (strain MB_m1) TaxID=1072389 RepID=K1WQU8_MARBU|nr:uncharacterized protein MBM_01967 [Drepanopeziza brunnea f. sp. 'multigermtubi' MB_m1]EKD20015.1 hypothetical protein MBM_01967 [Drepanopeziza brunnea f. sp. 'multigermtubi' MB_m1]KAJ5050425.1 hypothetical protein L3040_002308 [Drepanopeziza brunnea f. sp. 'multigermtubi']
MMLRSKSISATLLALSVLFSEAQGFFWQDKHTVIGYATVPSEEAQRINADNKVHVRETDSLTQLGPGFFIVSEPDSWFGGEDSWFCAVMAKGKKMKQIPKAYIPKSYEVKTWNGWVEEYLWGAREQSIVEYIRSELSIKKADEALRVSWVKGMAWHLHMLIPKKVVENDNLDLWAQCFETIDELMAFSDETIKWEDWKIKGDPGPKGFSRTGSLRNTGEDPNGPPSSPVLSSTNVPFLESV